MTGFPPQESPVGRSPRVWVVLPVRPLYAFECGGDVLFSTH